MGSTLKTLADEMWKIAEEHGRAELTLSGGLRVICKVEGRTRKLAMCRPGERVPYDETSIMKAHFGVPQATWPEELPLGGGLWKCYTWPVDSAGQLSLFGGGGVMHLIRVGRRFVNLELMRHAQIAPSGDAIYIYWHNHALSDTEAAGYDCEAFRGQEAWRLIDYLTEHCEALIWADGE